MPSKQSAKRKPQRRENVAKESALRKGDSVMVIAGGNKHKHPIKGQVGKIAGFRGKDRSLVIVEGVNLRVKHQRQTAPGRSAGRIQQEAPVHISNLMYYVEKLKKPVRLRHSFLEDGRKVRGYRDPETKEFVQI